MRAYLIASDAGLDDVASDAVVLDARVVSASLRAEGEAIQGRGPDVADMALDCFASLAMTEGGGATRRLIRVGGIETPDLDACLDTLAVLAPDAIVLPARHGRDVAHLGSRLAVHEAEHGLSDGGIGVVAILSCAAGVLAAASFVGASPRLCGLGWDPEALARQLGMPEGPTGSAHVTSPPHPEVPERSGGLEERLRGTHGRLEPPFEARLRLAPQDEGVVGTRGRGRDAWGASPVLAHVRSAVRLAAAAAGVEAIEAAYPGDDAEEFGRALAAARRDGFAAMFACDRAQVRLIRADA